MKHLLRPLVLCIICLGICPIASAFNVTNFDGVSISYKELSSTTCEVTGYSGALPVSGTLNIPSTVTNNGNTYDVVSIGSYALSSKAFKAVTLPESLLSIGNYAFQDCSALTSITIPESLEVLGDYSFDGCKGLKSVYYNAINCTSTLGPRWGYWNDANPNLTLDEVKIGNKVKTIPSCLFMQTGITTVVIPNSVEVIGESAFDTCSKLLKVQLPNSVKVIHKNGFRDCYELESISLGNSIEYIGDYAISQCENLRSVVLPESLKHLGIGPFRYNCTSFYGKGATSDHRSIVLNDTLVQWAPSSLENVEILNVKVPSGVKYIGTNAIYGYGKLINIELPESVIGILESAIVSTNLKSFTVPSSVEYLGDRAVDTYNLILSSENPNNLTIGSLASDCKNVYVPFGLLSDYENKIQVSRNDINIYELKYDIVDGTTYTSGVNYWSYPYSKFSNGRFDLPSCHVTYTRNFTKTTWQAFYIPYDMAYEDWWQYGDIARINNVHQFDTDGDGIIDETSIEFVKVKSGRFVPNVPYIFKPKKTGEITFESDKCMLKAAPAKNGYVDCSSTTNTYTFTGVYSTTEGLYSKDAYTLFDEVLLPIEANNDTLSPFRFYMTITPREGYYNDYSQTSKPRRIRIFVDGEEETTGFEDLMIQPTDSGIYYDLQGRAIVNPKNGIYIKNGKKIFIHN